MGLYDREYYRDSEGSGWWAGFAGRQATVGLMMVIGGVFFLQLMTLPPGRGAGPDLLTKWGAFYLPDILDGQVWRLVTALFLHDSSTLWHVVLNLFMLYMFGSTLEGIYGTREFLAFYLTAGLVVSLGKAALIMAGIGSNVPSLGASGPITALLILYACHFPYQTVNFYLVLPIPMWLLAVIVVALDSYGLFSSTRHIGFTAHLIGALFGFLYYRQKLRVSSLWDWFTQLFSGVRRRPRLSVYRGPSEPEISVAAEPRATRTTEAEARPSKKVDEQLEAKLDQVLEKVSRFGKESLTSEENDILLRASEIYKRRRES